MTFQDNRAFENNRCFLMRHGETQWSLDHRHTGRTDLPLLPEGRVQAEALRDPLSRHAFPLVLTSPLLRARETCALAGLGDEAMVDEDLAEWDYGDYEGRTTVEIRSSRPTWNLFDDGGPHGESAADVAVRVDRVIARVRATEGDVACFAHSHVLRVLIARWVGLDPGYGRCFTVDPASISVVQWEREQPVVGGLNLRAH
jgi:probable phosphoglycerate mutase